MNKANQEQNFKNLAIESMQGNKKHKIPENWGNIKGYLDYYDGTTNKPFIIKQQSYLLF